MTQKITKSQKARMQNPIIQFFKYLWLNIKIIRIVALGHGGTRKG
ncbi:MULTISPECIES: hypothetical protein [unclassified Imperialibacter]|nr:MULTISPECIES: hypothetical protein [unclassified Imperialibacter]